MILLNRNRNRNIELNMKMFILIIVFISAICSSSQNQQISENEIISKNAQKNISINTQKSSDKQISQKQQQMQYNITETTFNSGSSKRILLEVSDQIIFIWNSIPNPTNEQRGLMQKKIQALTCQMNKNNAIALAEYNAKCSSTSCINFLDITCIFNNVYSMHVIQFCLFVFVVVNFVLIVIMVILRIHRSRFRLFLVLFIILFIGTLVPFGLSLRINLKDQKVPNFNQFKLSASLPSCSNNNPKPTPTPAILNSAISYPVRLAYIDKISTWWPPEQVAAGMGVPGYATPTIYNYIVFAFWSSNGPADIVSVWADPIKYFGTDSVFGTTKDQIQKNLKKKYNDNGVKILISAFGATQFPTTAGTDAVQCANKLADFVASNNLDGVDIDWEDNSAMEAGKGQDWIVKFHTQLRSKLPNHIITHAPQAPYFSSELYKNGGYTTVHQKVGNTIDFYNVQFYNQGDTKYNTYETLFENSGSLIPKTSVQQIVKRGVPSKKLVIGKPVLSTDVFKADQGQVDHSKLGQWISKAYTQYQWYAGVMYWQYASDLSGNAIKASTGYLKEQCQKNKNCI